MARDTRVRPRGRDAPARVNGASRPAPAPTPAAEVGILAHPLVDMDHLLGKLARLCARPGVRADTVAALADCVNKVREMDESYRELAVSLAATWGKVDAALTTALDQTE